MYIMYIYDDVDIPRVSVTVSQKQPNSIRWRIV